MKLHLYSLKLFIICSLVHSCSNKDNKNSKEAIHDTVFVYDSIDINRQKDIKNTDYCVTVNPIKQYGLFVNIENPIDVNVSGVPQNYIEVKCTNGKVSRIGNGFNIKPKEIGTTVVDVYYKEKLLRSFLFNSIKLPKPTPQIGNFIGKAIDKKKLLEIKGIWAKMPYFPDFYGAEILSFKIVTYNKGNTIEASSESCRFTNEQIELIEDLQSGQMLYFEDIKAKTEDGFEHDLEIIKVIIK